MPRIPSKAELRASRLIQQLNCVEIVQNDGTPSARKLHLSGSKTGVSVIKDGRLYSDDPKTKRPKCYTSITPDFLWNSDFIEVKDNVTGNTWNSLNRDSLNDQIRVSLLRARICGIQELLPQSYDRLTTREKDVAESSLLNFSKSDPSDRLYIRWEQLLSSITSPGDNFSRVIVSIAGKRLPIKSLNLPHTQRTERLFMLDSSIMDEWERLLR
jgi:hypothetical protein